MTANRLTVPGSTRRDTVRSMSKLLLSAVSLAFVLYLLTLLPGIDRLVPLTPVTFAAVVGAIATTVLVALILYSAPRLASLVRMRLNGPEPVVENVASIVYWLGILAAVLVAHRGLAGVFTPLMEGFVWGYDVVFLLLSLPVVAVIAARIYVSLDPGSDLLADRVVDGDDPTDEGVSDAPAENRESDRRNRPSNGE